MRLDEGLHSASHQVVIVGNQDTQGLHDSLHCAAPKAGRVLGISHISEYLPIPNIRKRPKSQVQEPSELASLSFASRVSNLPILHRTPDCPFDSLTLILCEANMQNHANNVAGELPEISLRLLPASAA